MGCTLSGFRCRMSTIFLPDSCPTVSPELSPACQPVVSDPSVLRKASSSYFVVSDDSEARISRSTSAVMLTSSGVHQSNILQYEGPQLTIEVVDDLIDGFDHLVYA